jgi:hypothetical protein
MRTPRRRSGPARRAAAATAAATLLALAGCGDDEPGPEAGPTPSSPSSPASPAPSVPSSPAGSETADPSVTPASGLPIRIRDVSLNAPDGWTRLSDLFSKLAKGAGDPRGASMVGLYSVPAFNADATVDQLAAAVEQTSHYVGKATVHEPVDVNGVECFHVSGRYPAGQVQHQFGVNRGDYQITVKFDFDPQLAEDEQQEVMDSVLASVTWG